MKKKINWVLRLIKSILKFLQKKVITKKWFEILCLLVILVGAFGIRLYKINNPLDDWHSWRQADTISVSQIYVDQGINLLKPQYYDVSPTQTGYYNPQGLRFVEFPIYNLINVVLFQKVGHFSLEVWARLISVVCATLSVFFLYLIGKEFLGKWGGLITAFLYAFIPYNIYFTRVILPEPMAVFFTISSLWFFIVFVKRKNSLILFLSMALFAMGMLLKPFVAFYFPIYLYLLIKEFGWKVFKKRVDIYVGVAISLIPFFLWRGWMNNGNGGYNQIGIPLFTWLLNGNGIRLRPAWFRWIFGTRLGDMILGVWGLPLFALGIFKKKNWPIIMAAVGMFLYVLVVADGNVQHDYYQTQTVPAIALMVASGIIFLLENFDKRVVIPFVGFCIVMMLGLGWYGIVGDYQINHYEIIVAGQEADKILPKDAIVIAPYNGDTTFLYQTKRFGWPVVDRSFDELIRMGADYYVSVNYDADTNQLLNKYKTIERNPTFVIIDLHQPLQQTNVKK